MSRTFIVGDIHGANKALMQVLEKVNFNYEKDTLISLGDIADGWNEVYECVNTLLKIKNLIAVRGNHDVWVYDWFKYGLQPYLWTEQGGKATIESYIKNGGLLEETHKNFWLEKQVNWYIDKDNNLFIHAGWDYRNFQDFELACTAKIKAGSIAMSCHWDRSIINSTMAAKSSNMGFKELEKFNKIFIGHTATKDSEVFNYKNLYNLDTGAGWSGKLTLMNLKTLEYVQSDDVRELYKNQKGRN